MTPKAPSTKKAKKAATTVTATQPAGESILGHAMLANVCISMWEGRKHDREVTQRVNEEHHATHDAGRYHKHLFGGKAPELSAIITAAAGLRLSHYTQTLPWSDSGWRLLPTANYMQYTEAMRAARTKFMTAVDAFVKAYPGLVKSSADRLQAMYRATDYPHPDAVRHRFRVALEFSPLPSGDDFRVNLPKKELDRVAAEVEERVLKSSTLAMQDAWQRLGDAVSGLREKLDDGKYLRDSMIGRLNDVAEILGRLNLTQDPALEVARKRVITELGMCDVDALRDDEAARRKAAASADAILKSMQGLYTPTVKEAK